MSKRAWIWLWLSLVLAFPISILQAAGPAPELATCMNHAVKIDYSRLESLRLEYEGSKGQSASEEDFMFSWLPTRIIFGLLFGEVNVKDLPSDFGLLYWSGFDGGVWLNKVVGNWLLGIIRLVPVNWKISFLRADKTPSRLQLIGRGSPGEKREALDEALTKGLTSLAGVYGYDRGYLMYILENPPAGAKTPEKFLVCGEFLECHYGAGDQAILDWLLPVRAKLNAEWKEIAAEVKKALPGSIKTGSWVWKGIMLGSKLSPDSYLTLLKLSRNFLMLNEAVMLKACQAVAEGDERQLDRALAADAALRVCLAGYLVGLGEKISAQ